ncbi:MAG: NAD(P)-dependent oxidoreductase [Clostridiales bacterium]|nr:NAD(P)-dependent oxidoreductase [Clostridiales bacterium]
MKKIIVLGATGNVGSYFTKYASEYFPKEEYQIIASGKREKADVFKTMGIEYISVDITKPEDIEKLPKEDVYAVVLLAAVIPAYMDGYHPENYLESIIMGTYNVLEYCRINHVEKLLYSTSCYDMWEYPSGTIIMPDMPRKFSYTGDHAMYVISKNTSCELIEHYHQQYGLKTFIFRFPTVYSYSTNHYIYPNGVKTLRPLYKLIFNAMEGKPLEIWGDPNYAKDMLYVDDMGQMFCLAIENQVLQKGFYNCGTGIPVTLMEQMEAIIKVFCPEDKKSEIIVLRDKIAGGGILMNVDNAKEELGYEPKFDVVKLFESFKEEMKYDRFVELRGK